MFTACLNYSLKSNVKKVVPLFLETKKMCLSNKAHSFFTNGEDNPLITFLLFLWKPSAFLQCF